MHGYRSGRGNGVQAVSDDSQVCILGADHARVDFLIEKSYIQLPGPG